MKNKSLNLQSILLPISMFLRRFHTIIFFIIVSAGLIAALLMIVSILNVSASTASKATGEINSSFDEQTIKRIDELGNTPPSKPGGRSNPFVE